MNGIKITLTLICTLLLNTIFAQKLPTQGLVAHYRFNKWEAGQDARVAYDQSGNSNNGQMKGGVSYTADRFGVDCSALWFDGNGYVKVPSSASLEQPQSEFSATVWIKIGDGADFFKQWLTIICKSDLSRESYNSPQYRVQGTAQTVSLNTELTENFVPPLDFDTWYFYVYTYDGSTLRVYLDGNEVYNFPYRGALNPNDYPLEIGRDLPGATEYFYGAMDDLRIYNRALTDREIVRLYKDQSDANSSDRCPVPPALVQNNPPITTPPVTPPDVEPEPVEETQTQPPVVNTPASTPQPASAPQPAPAPGPVFVPDPNTAPAPAPSPNPGPVELIYPDSLADVPVEYQDEIIVKNAEVYIYPFDNNAEDGDIVSINFNGEWILNKYELKNKSDKTPFLLPLKLDPTRSNFIISKAWTVGRRAPNTMTIEVVDGDYRRQIVLNSTLGLSAALKIIYQP
ncbi:MAG: LamG domain-containing protein [Bacteroidota bacterium]